MKYATSIYLGGEPIHSYDCDHRSSRELGLLCPACKEAVFLVNGYSFDRAGKRIDVDSHFSHYKDGLPECEMRCNQRSEKDWEKLRAEARHQRLELFNRHFLDVFWVALGESRYSSLGSTDQQSTRQWRKHAAKQLRNYLRTNIEPVQKLLSAECEKMFHERAPGSLLSSRSSWQRDSKELVGYCSNASKKMHECVAQEALMFLSQGTGEYALSRLCGYGLAKKEHFCKPATLSIQDQKTTQSDPRWLVYFVVFHLAAARWLIAFSDFLKE